MSRTLMVALPSRSPAAAQAGMPADAPAQALVAVDRLIEEEGRSTFEGFLEPAFRARWIASQALLSIGVDGRVLRPAAGRWVALGWRWGILWQTDDWYEVGWHPDEHILALVQPWQDRLWNALNPGKRPRR